MHAIIQDSFNISEGIDGSATSYTVIISSDSSNDTCGSANIPISSCVDRVCKYTFKNLSSPSCHEYNDFSRKLSVTVFASNILGNGLPSVPSFVGMCA